MQLLSQNEVIHYLTDIGALTNSNLNKIVHSGQKFFRIQLGDLQAFHSLIWQYVKATEILTPGTLVGGKQYTVGDVANFMLSKDITFESLANGSIEGSYQSEWFKSCVDIKNNFDYDSFDDLIVTLPNNGEQRDCPLGTFKLVDGMHRSIVLAYLLAEGSLEYRTVHCILVLNGRKLPWILS